MVTPAMSIALSGITAQSQRLAATASNVAGAGVSGAAPESPEAQAGAQTVYRSLTVYMTSQQLPNGIGAGVMTEIKPNENGFYYVYAPDQPNANSDGLIAVPAVDLTSEMVNLLETKSLFKANVAVLRQQDEMIGQLLDALS